jgi:flagellar basal-body rod modification protein FlgD
MATVNNASNSTPSAADIFAGINGKSSGAAKSATADMENRFLTLLVTQIKNQDPLNPLDNAQVTSQLAQINTVNGIEKLNTTLGKLLSAYDDSKAMQSASMIGKNVLVPGDDMVASTDGGAIGGVALEADADKVLVKILDSSGKVVQTEDLGAKSAGNFGFVWDGKDADGKEVPAGNYHFTVEATKGDQKIGASTLQIGTVSAVVRGNNGFKLDLGEAGIVDFNSVQQIL